MSPNDGGRVFTIEIELPGGTIVTLQLLAANPQAALEQVLSDPLLLAKYPEMIIAQAVGLGD
jgi:hypothetical protein